MKFGNSDCTSKSCIFIEAPRWGDLEFYGNWLLSVAKAEELRQQAMSKNAEILSDIHIEPMHMLDFEIAATAMVRRLAAENFYSFVIDTDPDHPELMPDHMNFAVMAQMEFFALKGDRCRMTLPQTLNIDRLRQAYLKLASTNHDGWPRPERLVVDMPYIQAVRYQDLLRKISDPDRGAILHLH